MVKLDPLRHLHHVDAKASPFGEDKFGQVAEKIARTFGTARYILIQSGIVLVWIILNGLGIVFKWDAYPFILLNLAFSLQAAYAAPLILLAQTRQAERDKAHSEAIAKHNQEESDQLKSMVEQNTVLTQQVAQLTEEIHAKVDKPRSTRRKAT